VDLGLEGRVAVVAASSRGLGRATAEALAADGAHVLLNGRDEAALDDAVAGITAAGGTAAGVLADITEPAVPAELVDDAVARWGRIDIVVGNAGGPPPARALDVDDDALVDAVNANLLSSVRLARAAVPHLRAGGWGRICFITSVSVRQPSLASPSRTRRGPGCGRGPRRAAQDLAADGITVNLACPGPHATARMTSLGAGAGAGPLGDPADFGKVVAFLCSEPAAFVSGTAVGVDGASVSGLL
jgi:3-oxoacyl-[acyl-carrier protein] reductase